MSYLRYVIDGTVMVNEPLDWEKITITIEREKTIKGLFVNYIEQLTFVGDAYNYLLSIINTVGFCSTPSISITEMDSSTSVTLNGFSFTGLVVLSTAVLDRSRCTIKAGLQDNSLSGVLLQKKTFKLDIALNSKTLNGLTLAAPIVSIGMPAPVNNRYAISIFNLFQYILSYISDNQIVFVSDWFGTKNLLPKTTTYTAPSLGILDTLTVRASDLFDEPNGLFAPYSMGAIFSTTSLTGAQVAADIANGLTYNKDTNPLYGFDFSHALFGVSRTGADLTMINFDDFYFEANLFPFTNNGTVTQNYSDGGANVYLTSGEEMKAPAVGSNISLGKISFEDLFVEMNKLFNLEFQLYKEGGINYCRVEPQEYFFNASLSTTLNDVTNYKEKLARDLFYSSFDYKNGYRDETESIQRDASWTFNNCATQPFKCDLSFLYGQRAFENYAEMNTDDFFVFEVSGSSMNQYLLSKNNGTGVTIQQIVTSAVAIHQLVVKRHLSVLNGSATRGGHIIVSDSELLLAKEVDFEAPLDCESRKAITQGHLSYINYNNGMGVIESGWIKKIEIPFRGESKFNLYTA